MGEGSRRRVRFKEPFWRAHHEAWKRSDLNQREYCEAQGIPLKAFGNWRARFVTEPQPTPPKLLHRRGGLNHTLNHSVSHTPSHSVSHGAYPTTLPPLIVPPEREGHRRRFNDADRRRILAEAEQPGASLSEIARRYDIDRRILCRWKRGLARQAPRFVAVEIVDAPREEIAS